MRKDYRLQYVKFQNNMLFNLKTLNIMVKTKNYVNRVPRRTENCSRSVETHLARVYSVFEALYKNNIPFQIQQTDEFRSENDRPSLCVDIGDISFKESLIKSFHV